MRHLVLVRHGESELNARNRHIRTYCGQVETPLTDFGREQARLAGQRVAQIAYLNLTAAICSPLQRAEETLAILLGQLAAPLDRLLPDPRLMERSHGQFEGLTEEAVHRDYPRYRDDPACCHFMNHFEQAAPGGENLAVVTHRAWSAVLQLLAATTSDVILVSHFNPIRCILGRALDKTREETLKLHIPNAVPIVLGWNGTFSLVESPNLSSWE